MTNYTYEEKQRALNEAHEVMKNDSDRLEGIEEYINSALARYTTPILNEDDLKFLIKKAEKGCRND